MPRRIGDSSAVGVDAVAEQPLAVVEVVDGPEAFGAREQAVDHDAEQVRRHQLDQLVAAASGGVRAQRAAQAAPDRLDERRQDALEVTVAGPRRGLPHDPLGPAEREGQTDQAAPCTTAAIDAAGAAARAGGGGRRGAEADGATLAWFWERERREEVDQETERPDHEVGHGERRRLPWASHRSRRGDRLTGLKVATHGSHAPSCRSTTPTRFDGATASSHVRMGHDGSDRSRSSAS